MARVHDDDRPTVDLGPRAPEDDYDPDADGQGDSLDSLVEPPTARADVAEATKTVATSRDGSPDTVHQLPTQQLDRRSRRSSSSSLTKAANTTTASPVEAMRHDEWERSRVFIKAVLLICLGGVVVALTSAGDPIARTILLIATAISTSGAVWLFLATRESAKFNVRRLAVPGIMILVGTMAGVYYWGTVSPVTAMIVYGIYFFSLGSDARVTFLMYVIVAALHGALALAIITGILDDRGIVSMGHMRTLDQVTLLCIIEFLYLIAFATARVSQRVTLDAMTKLEQAVRSVSQRDALLAEARAELDRALKVGGPGRFTEQVVGAFRLGILIGRGGMGEVYEARSVSDQREAAVKLLHPGTLADPTHVARFLREAQTAASLDCPHVVRVLEVGTTQGEVPFLAMERLRGTDLAHQLRRHRKIPLDRARSFAEQVARGLEAARVAGIVHRDLKPHNVFLAEAAGERRWKILDFGVSKTGTAGTLTKGHVVGTPAYMAPEQARGEDVDHRADVYSLAAILFRSVTGHPAFSGKDVPSTLYDVVYRVPTQPSILANVPADIDRVLAIGLAKDPRDRFSTAVELAEWFTAAADAGLTPDQRRRADDVIARYPWGTRPGVATIS